MDSLLFLIKKHNNNRTAGYDKLAYIIYKQKWIRWGSSMTHVQYYIQIIKLQKV